MKIGLWAGLMAAAALMAGCGDFWQSPNGSITGFTLSSSPTSITVAQSSSGTSTITVTPGSSFTGTVTLSCAITTAPSSNTSPTTCSLSSSSLTFSSATTQTSTLTATSGTSTGTYDITVTGVSGNVAETTTVCVEVGTGSCTVAATSSGNFYILNGGSSGSIAGFSISGGALAAISGSSQPVSGATAVAIAPSGEAFLYVASTTNGITLYPITSTGALSPGVSFNDDMQAEALAVDPSGKWLLDASGTGTLTAYPITSTGTLDTSRTAQPQSLTIGTGALQPRGITISPNGAIVAVALGSAGTQAFSFSSGTLEPGATPIKPTNTSSGTAISVATDPQSRFLYIGEIASNSTANSGGLRVFTITGGTLAELNASSPSSSGGVAPNFILPVASGDFVYVANGEGAGNPGNVTGFAVTASGISTGSTVAAGDQPLGMAEDSTGSWVFEVGSSGSPYFDAYTFDATTPGKLDSQVTSTSAATSIAIVAAPQ
jgi:6-phosphogluconolactonase